MNDTSQAINVGTSELEEEIALRCRLNPRLTRRIGNFGFIELEDTWGDEATIINTARISSTNKRLKDLSAFTEKDKNLLYLLLKHNHGTPFETVYFRFRFIAPIFVMRQWVKHRISCLGPDVELYFDLPRTGRPHFKQYTLKVSDLHRKWHRGRRPARVHRKPLDVSRLSPGVWYGVNEISALTGLSKEQCRALCTAGELVACKEAGRWRISGASVIERAAVQRMRTFPMRNQLSAMRLRSVDENTGEVVHTRVTDIFSTGINPVFRVTLADGKTIDLTENHRVLTEEGWRPMAEAVGLRFDAGKGKLSWRKDAPRWSVNGIPVYQSAEWLANQRAAGKSVREIARAAACSYHTVRKYLRDFGLQFSHSEWGRQIGRSQRGRCRGGWGSHSLETRRRMRALRSGARSNFYKGGASGDRELVAAWTTRVAPEIHARHRYRCCICASSKALQAHHIEPVWHNRGAARDIHNLATLCSLCHRKLHAGHRELAFMAWYRNPPRDPLAMQRLLDIKVSPAPELPLPRGKRLARTFVAVREIDYLGEQETFDLEVEGPWHNLIANGVVVHNSWNEFSMRYRKPISVAYVPDKKARSVDGFEVLSDDQVAEYTELVRKLFEWYEAQYEKACKRIDAAREEGGIPPKSGGRDPYRGRARELLRNITPVAAHSDVYWTVNFRSLMNFFNLRRKPEAQHEIRQYADAAFEMFCEKFPLLGEIMQRVLEEQNT